MKARAYHSPARQKQADTTRNGIALAARALLLEKGFDATTVSAIAKHAGVAPQTVYATFGSKAGVLKAVMDLARFGPTYRDAVRAALAEKEPEKRLRFASRIAASIFSAERAELDLWRGASVVSLELADVEHTHEELRFTSQAPMIDLLTTHRRLRKGLDRESARQILWALTSRDFFRMLVVERKWTVERYQEWLGQTLVESLMDNKRRY